MVKMLPWGVHTLSSMIGSPDCAAGLPDGRWARAVPLPYFGTLRERLRAAWWVFTGRAYAVEWPEPGELEMALNPYARRAALSGDLPKEDRNVGHHKHSS